LAGAASMQVFLSYARIDDELPPNESDGRGFVTALEQDLTYLLRQRGDLETKIWRDKRRIDPTDQFNSVIQKDIDNSDLFIVLLSPNWMSRPWCKLELDRFRERWKHEGEEGVKHRIIVASKRFVSPAKRHSLLQGQVGHSFFGFEDPGNSGAQFEFFTHGKARDDRYYKCVEELAQSLALKTQQIGKKTTQERKAFEQREAKYQTAPAGAALVRPRVAEDARKIYLAKPASDMREAYSRLVDELMGAGYAIVPDPAINIPYDSSAARFVDEALAETDVSIHLLGESAGYVPEGCDPIVNLQLSRAKVRANAANGNDNGVKQRIRRIIWAPESVEAQSDEPASEDQSAQADSPSSADNKRDPQDVLKSFSDELATDKVLGGNLSRFVDFLTDHLRQSGSGSNGISEITDDDWVYVYHVPEDTKFACDLMDALRDHGISISPPVFEGPPGEVMRIHKQRLAECSAVVLCWAEATEAWADANAHELRDWKKLGREKKFAYRGLLAGPPPGDRKRVFVKYPRKNQIDIIVNLSEGNRPVAEAVEQFAHPTLSHAP
jgi:hypothetical protein